MTSRAFVSPAWDAQSICDPSLPSRHEHRLRTRCEGAERSACAPHRAAFTRGRHRSPRVARTCLWCPTSSERASTRCTHGVRQRCRGGIVSNPCVRRDSSRLARSRASPARETGNPSPVRRWTDRLGRADQRARARHCESEGLRALQRSRSSGLDDTNGSPISVRSILPASIHRTLLPRRSRSMARCWPVGCRGRLSGWSRSGPSRIIRSCRKIGSARGWVTPWNGSSRLNRGGRGSSSSCYGC